jgi:hypothetical protein
MFVDKIRLNYIMDDHQFNYMTNMIEKVVEFVSIAQVYRRIF